MKKKIYVRMFGGVGNQLFIYAFAKATALKTASELILDNKSGFIKDPYKRKFRLGSFNLTDVAIGWRGLFYTFFRKISYPVSKFIIPNSFKERDYNKLEKKILDVNFVTPIYFEGYWQSYLYFAEYEKIIRSDLSFKGEFSDFNKNLNNKIVTTNSLAVHIRRIDYDNLLDISYFLKGIQIISNKIDNINIFVFSDDSKWAKKNLQVNLPTYFVDNNLNDEIADLWLMSNCKYFIIANSTFSWWGAWLATFKDKIVIAPANHIGVKDFYYPKDWISI